MGGRRRGRARRLLRRFLAFLFSNVGVTVLVLAYTIAGALMFSQLEGAGEVARARSVARERNATVAMLWSDVAIALNPYNNTELLLRINEEVHAYQKRVVQAVRKGWDGGAGGKGGSLLGVGGEVTRQWSFSSAFLYSLTVITTIGYGNLSPRTAGGKVATILYALLGMPLFLLYLSNIGDLFARWFKCVYALLCLCRGCPGFTRRRRAAQALAAPPSADHFHNHIHRRSEGSAASSAFSYVSFDAQTITVPLSVCVCILVGYILFGSMIFGMWERWDQLDGAYFCFISLSSIGFGDIVPGERVYTPRIETSFIVCSLYLTLGMALVAMCFNLMQEQVIHYFAGGKRAFKRITRCKR